MITTECRIKYNKTASYFMYESILCRYSYYAKLNISHLVYLIP